MNLKRLTIIALVSLQTFFGAAFSQERQDSISLTVYFQQDRTDLDCSYRDNCTALDAFVTNVKSVIANPAYRLQDITIRSGASPEGRVAHNLELSQGRGLTLKEYLQGELHLPDDKFNVNAIGEDWPSLRAIVAARDVPAKDEILAILDSHSDYYKEARSTVDGSPKKDLMDLNGGKTWFWLLDNIFPDLRSAGNKVVCRYILIGEPVVEPEPAVEPEPVVENITVFDTIAVYDTISVVNTITVQDTVIVQDTVTVQDTAAVRDNAPIQIVHRVDTLVIVHEYVPQSNDSLINLLADRKIKVTRSAKTQNKLKKGLRYRFGVKTNLALDLAAAPNLGLEFPIGKRMSLMAEAYSPWYTYDTDRYAYQLQMANLEARYWFGDRSLKPKLNGWYAGLYGGAVHGDIEWESKGRQVDLAWNMGLSAGYSWTLGKRDNWRLEAGLSAGYVQMEYRYYERHEIIGRLIQKDRGRFTWTGPTKIDCSLVWLLPRNRKDKSAK